MIKYTFSEKVKREITTIQYKDEIFENILYSFILNNGSFNISNKHSSYNITISQNFVVRYIKKLMNYIFSDINSSIWYKQEQISHGYLIVITDTNLLEKKYNLFVSIKDIILSDEAKKGFIIGAFLSSGSIHCATKKSSYHFEIRSNNLEYLEKIKEILFEYQIKSSIIHYRNSYKLYFKKSEYLSDILKIMETEESMFYFEDIRIKKDFSNSLQRLTNLEVSNINKTVIASKNHITWIKFLMENNLMDEFNDKTKKFCEIRIKHPDASLSTISRMLLEKYKINIPRTSINHILKRIESKYNQNK